MLQEQDENNHTDYFGSTRIKVAARLFLFSYCVVIFELSISSLEMPKFASENELKGFMFKELSSVLEDIIKEVEHSPELQQLVNELGEIGFEVWTIV